MNDATSEDATHAAPQWRPLSATQRRVVGVLVEKAKTTPDAYPLTLNSLKNGCNQKSNRFPVMQLEEDQVEDALEELRGMGAVAEVVGGSRTAKYRHYLYDWLGVDKVQLAVMAELLLRGAQTEGELRGRAARMEPISDLAALRPILAELKQKNLIVSITPEGRGHVLTHNLYQPAELERIRRDHGAESSPGSQPPAAAPQQVAPSPPPGGPATTQTPATTDLQQRVEDLQRGLSEADGRIAELSSEVESLNTRLQQGLEKLDDMIRQVGGM